MAWEVKEAALIDKDPEHQENVEADKNADQLSDSCPNTVHRKRLKGQTHL